MSEEIATVTLAWGETGRPFHFRPSTHKDDAEAVITCGKYDLNQLTRITEIMAYISVKRKVGLKPLVVDIGAGPGAAAVYFKHCLPDSQIVCFESNPEDFTLLEKNVEGLNIGLVRSNSAIKGAVAITDLYDVHADECFPFIVKISTADYFGRFEDKSDWIVRTPIILVTLADDKKPREGNSRGILQSLAAQDRDFIIFNDVLCSIANTLPFSGRSR